MEKVKYGKWLDEWMDSLAPAVSAMDSSTWGPFDQLRLFPYYGDLWVEKLLQAKREAERKGISLKQLAKAFLGPLAVRIELMFTAFDLKATGMNETEKGVEVIEFLNDILKEICIDDVYGLKSSRIHTKKELEEIEKKIKWKKADLESAREVGRLINSGSELSWSFYSDYLYENYFENHGPYRMGDEILVIRNYRDFKPIELWEEAADYRIKEVNLYTKYRNIEIWFDSINHMFCKGNTARNMCEFAVEINGKFVESNEEIGEASEYLGEIAAEQYTRFSDLPFEQLKRKTVEQRHYNYRKFFLTAGMDWKPTEECLKRVENVELLPEVYPEFKNLEESTKYWRDLFDPREESFPEEWKADNFRRK